MRQNFFHHGRPDKDCREGLLRGAQERQVQGRLETFRLPAKVISVYANVEAADEFLSAFLGPISRFGEQDQPGTGAPCRFPMDPTE